MRLMSRYVANADSKSARAFARPPDNLAQPERYSPITQHPDAVAGDYRPPPGPLAGVLSPRITGPPVVHDHRTRRPRRHAPAVPMAATRRPADPLGDRGLPAPDRTVDLARRRLPAFPRQYHWHRDLRRGHGLCGAPARRHGKRR